MDKSEDRKEKTLVAVRMTKAESLLLKKRAKREGLSVSALIRRFALGLAALSLVACGGGDFKSGSDPGAAGMPSAGGGAGMSGSAGLGAAAGNGGGYDGPAWIDCSGSAVVARGFSAPWSEVNFSVTAASHGPDWSLMTLVPTINGELPPLVSTNKSRSMDSANQTLTFTLSSPIDPSFAASDLIEVSIGWQPMAPGNIDDVSPSACSATVSGEPWAAWP